MTAAKLELQDFFLLLQEQAMSLHKLSQKVGRGTTAGQTNCMREKATRASSEIVYSQRTVLHVVFIVCLHSLLLGNSNPAFCLPSPWQEIFASLGFWTAETAGL